MNFSEIIFRNFFDSKVSAISPEIACILYMFRYLGVITTVIEANNHQGKLYESFYL